MSDYLPEELVFQIFTKLPVKSLLRFRTLSKSWCSIISSPDFIRNHTVGVVKTTQKVLVGNNKVYEKGIYTLHQEDQLPLSSGEGYLGVTAVELPRVGFRIVGSCNGILCLAKFSSFPLYVSISLWNFSVRRQLKIPRHFFRSMCMATIGFGFDPVTNDYKILTVHYEAPLVASLYTLSTSSWSEIAPPATMFYYPSRDSCFVNKTLHWGASESQDICHYVIMTFDLNTHVFGTISLPEPSWEFEQLTKFNGSLAVMCTKGDDSWIWVRTESDHTPSWSVFLKLDAPEFRYCRILQPTSNGDLFIHTYHKYLNDVDDKVYNSRTGVSSTLSKFRPNCNIHMFTYVESLELVDRGTPCGESIKWTKEIYNDDTDEE